MLFKTAIKIHINHKLPTMKKQMLFLLLMSLSVLIACKKDAKKDCDTNNYGIVKITFAHPADTYWIAANSRIKIEPAGGISSDTFHCAPGSVNIQSLNKNTSEINVQVINVQTCKESVVNSPI